MRTKTIAAAIAIAAAFAACKKEDKGATSEDKPKDPSTKPTDPATPENPKPADPQTPPAQTPPAATASADSVTIKVVPPAVGAKWSEEKIQTMDLAIKDGAQVIQMLREGTEKKQIEVLALTGPVVTKAKITYDVTEKQTMGGKTKEGPSPISGKTYVLELAGDKLTITTDGGAAPSAEEIAIITKEEEDFGKPEKMLALIDGRTFKKGEAVEFPADQIKDVMGAKAGMTVTKLSLTYTGNEGSDPAFDWTLGFTQDDKGMKITAQASGKITADLTTGELLTMNVEGPIEMSGKATATGTMKIAATRTLRQ